METKKLIELLRATIDPGQRQQAEEQLTQVGKPHVLKTCVSRFVFDFYANYAMISKETPTPICLLHF